MGEKIKDIKIIMLADSEMTVELNAGNHGYIIHIQNDKIRYELKEEEFLQLAGMIIRAKAELDYIKTGDGDG
jgi:hypothetical protein